MGHQQDTDGWLSYLPNMSLCLPLFGVVWDGYSFDPQSSWTFVALGLLVLAWIPWLRASLAQGTPGTGCLKFFALSLAFGMYGIALFIVSLWLSDQVARSVVKVNHTSGSYRFDIGTRGVNGLHRITVWDTDTWEMYWRVEMHGFHNRRLTYGEIPTNFRLAFSGNLRDAQQSFPAVGQPKSLPPGKTFLVDVSYQFDVLGISPSIGGDEYAFTTNAQGHVVSNDWVRPGTYPMEHERTAIQIND